MKANKRPRARVEDKTGARLGEGRRTEKDEGPRKNKNKRNRLEVGEGEGGGESGTAIEEEDCSEIRIKKKIEGRRGRKKKGKMKGRNKKGKEDGDYGVGRRKARRGEARKIKERKERKEENEEEIIHENVEEGKKKRQDRCKEKRRMKKTGSHKRKESEEKDTLKEETGKRCKKQVDATKFQTNGREYNCESNVVTEQLEKLLSINSLARANTVNRNAWNSFEIGYILRETYVFLRMMHKFISFARFCDDTKREIIYF